jgi:hypothetical protein
MYHPDGESTLYYTGENLDAKKSLDVFLRQSFVTIQAHFLPLRRKDKKK